MEWGSICSLKSKPRVMWSIFSYHLHVRRLATNELIFFYPEKIAHWTDAGEQLTFMGKNGTDHNHKKLLDVLDSIPSIKNMSGWKDSADLKAYLDSIDLLIYPLLVWLITTNCAYLRQLRPKERFNDVKTPFQYVMVSSSSKREQMFNRAKETAKKRTGKGSIYMFHGSPIGNWHSILRTGLQIKGGGGLGASGPAIWMANDFSTSHGYCTKEGLKGGWKNSQFGNNLYCMAILEVVNDKSKAVDGTQPVNVIKDVSIICTRYFLVFKDAIPMLNVRAVNLPIRDFEL